MLLDTTLREGAQAVGVQFPKELQVRILRDVVRAGIEMVEIGWVGKDGIEDLAAAAQRHGLASRCAIWAPCRPEILDTVAKLGLHAVHVGIPVSPQHLARRLKISVTEALQRLVATIGTARSLGLTIRVGLEDASSAPLHAIEPFLRTAERAGAHGVRLADTRGIWTPQTCAETVRWAQSITRLPVGVHCHDDFGMATANALCALDAGGHWADVSLLGLGERAGISALEEVAGYLTLIRASRKDDMRSLRQLCHEVAHSTGLSLDPRKAIAGKHIFTSESGLHVDGLLKDPGLFEPCPPERLGMQRHLLWGAKSGRGAVVQLLSRHGLLGQGVDVEQVLAHVRKHGAQQPLEAEEVLHLAQQLLNTPKAAPLPTTN